MDDVRRGLIIVNTGPGKGKTTAAMGTALRAVGQGMRVLMLLFLKGSWHYGELDAVKAFGDNFIMKQLGRGFVKVGGAETDPEDIRMVEAAWEESRAAIMSGQWDLVILDEINYAISYGMLDPARVVEALKQKPEMVHVILTGRNAHSTIIDIADTVTEMREVKHAYQKGIEAQHLTTIRRNFVSSISAFVQGMFRIKGMHGSSFIGGVRGRQAQAGRLFQLISGDFEFVTVGIAKINRVRNFVILELERDLTLFEFALRGEKILAIGTKCQMQHVDLAGTRARS